MVATRSRVCVAFGSPSSGTTAVVSEALGECSDPTEIRCNRFHSLHDAILSGDNEDVKHPVRIESAAWLRAKLRSDRLKPGFKRDPAVKDSVVTPPRDSYQCEGRPSSKHVASVTDHATRGPRPDNDLVQAAQGESEGLESHSLSPSTSETSELPPTMRFGMYAGRVKANPLKYLATLLRSKLQPQPVACNLLEIATQIHDEAKNKHNTTLRRIYDVVNVLEAAGLLERSSGNVTCKRFVSESPSGESANLAVSGYLGINEDSKQVGVSAGRRMTCKTDLVEKRSARGSNIRWLGPPSECEERYQKQVLHQLQMEITAATQRISEKQHELESLQEELRLTTTLINHNQNRFQQSEWFQTHVNLCTPPEEEDHDCYLNFEESQVSETDSSQPSEPGAVEMTSARELHYNNPSITAEDDLNAWYPSVNEIEMNALEAANGYQTEDLPYAVVSERLPIADTLRKGLHIPFVILQTNNSTNVDIELDGNETGEVYITVDNEYQLCDFRELLSSMFPRQK